MADRQEPEVVAAPNDNGTRPVTSEKPKADPDTIDQSPSATEPSSEFLDGSGASKHLGLNATEDDILEAKEFASTLSLERTRELLQRVFYVHEDDPNFPHETLEKIKVFLADDSVTTSPEKHDQLIEEMKIQAAIITNNSPYAEVRAVVDNFDDPTTPVSTIRSWVLGILFAGVISFVNQLFSIRIPPIAILNDVAQLLAFPLGKAWEKFMPFVNIPIPFTGTTIPLNPGRFNKKEHMMITIMAGVAIATPYSNQIFWVQYLPQFFGQSYAGGFGYMIVNNLATNFIGYGLAGIVRQFLVYPSYCVWPASLVTIALNSALHNEENHPVQGLGNRPWTVSRFKFFMIAFFIMFFYFWIPGYLFTGISLFSWMAWIKPNNMLLSILTGSNSGQGMGLFNPLPSLDWNIISFTYDPLMYPSFSIFNMATGMFISGLVILAMYFTNSWQTGYLPINTNQAFDHYGLPYNVSLATDALGHFDAAKYQVYSAPYLSAAQVINYMMFFALYSIVIVNVVLHHRYEVMLGFKSLWRSLRRKEAPEGAEEGQDDVHGRLMKAYPEVSEWWYMAILAVSTVLGIVGLACWPTSTSPATPLFGIAMCLVFIIPTGIVTAMTGIPVPLNVISEFIGGLVYEGNAIAMNFFKCYGHTTATHTMIFANDLKLAHYLHIPPKVTFWAQIIGTFVCTMVSTGLMVFQMNLKDVCTPNAPMKFTCPNVFSFYTSSVLWGTIGPRKSFGAGGPYQWMLMAFPFGAVAAITVFSLKKKWPKNTFLRQISLGPAFVGGTNWGAYNFAYQISAVYVAYFSWHYVKNRYLSFWSKYNYVLSAAWSTGVAICAIIMFFSVQWTGTSLVWWGNTVNSKGCGVEIQCNYKTLDMTTVPPERFYPWWDNSKIPAP